MQAVIIDKKLYIWGDAVSIDMTVISNSQPKVSRYEDIPTIEPDLIEGFDDVVAVSCYNDHYIFLTAMGELYGCGYNVDNVLGLGKDQSDEEYSDECFESPVKIDTSLFVGDIKSIVTFGFKTIIITDEGRTYISKKEDNKKISFSEVDIGTLKAKNAKENGNNEYFVLIDENNTLYESKLNRSYERKFNPEPLYENILTFGVYDVYRNNFLIRSDINNHWTLSNAVNMEDKDELDLSTIFNVLKLSIVESVIADQKLVILASNGKLYYMGYIDQMRRNNKLLNPPSLMSFPIPPIRKISSAFKGIIIATENGEVFEIDTDDMDTIYKILVPQGSIMLNNEEKFDRFMSTKRADITA